MLNLRQIYSKYFISLVLATIITVLYALIGFSPQSVGDLIDGKGGGDELVMVGALTVVFLISLFLIFVFFIMKLKVDRKFKLKYLALYLFSSVFLFISAGIIWASLISIIGGIAILASILLSPWLAYVLSEKA